MVIDLSLQRKTSYMDYVNGTIVIDGEIVFVGDHYHEALDMARFIGMKWVKTAIGFQLLKDTKTCVEKTEGLPFKLYAVSNDNEPLPEGWSY